jgi:hypothetical protein
MQIKCASKSLNEHQLEQAKLEAFEEDPSDICRSKGFNAKP